MRFITVHIYRDRKGQFRWRAVASNGRIVADSGEGYTTKRRAIRGWQSLSLRCIGGKVSVTDDTKPR